MKARIKNGIAGANRLDIATLRVPRIECSAGAKITAHTRPILIAHASVRVQLRFTSPIWKNEYSSVLSINKADKRANNVIDAKNAVFACAAASLV